MSGPKQTLEQMSLLRDRLSEPLYARYMDYFRVTSHGDPKHEITVMGADGKPSGFRFCQRERKRIDMADR